MANKRKKLGPQELLLRSPLVQHLRLAITNEKRDMDRYEKLIPLIKNEKVRQIIIELNKDEERHLSLLEKIYFQLTNNFAEASMRQQSCRGSLKEIIKNCSSDESKMIQLYSTIYKELQDMEMKNIVSGIVIDEQAHEWRLNSIEIEENLNQRALLLPRFPVTVIPKEIPVTTDIIKENIKIPVIRGINNENIQRQINTSIESDIMEFKRQMEEAAKEYSEEAAAQGEAFIPYVIATNYTLTYDKNNIISISLIYSQYIGGRQSYIMTSYNFDTMTGRSLSLADLFKPGAPYRDLINRAIRKELQTNTSLYPPDAASKFQGIADDQPFYLDNKELVLYFGFHEIAPTLAQIPIIRIPFAEFRNYMKPIFFT